MKRTPVNVAIGSRLMNGLKMSVNNNMKTPDIVELTRWRAPFIILIVDCPIIASPPMAKSIGTLVRACVREMNHKFQAEVKSAKNVGQQTNLPLNKPQTKLASPCAKHS